MPGGVERLARRAKKLPLLQQHKSDPQEAAPKEKNKLYFFGVEEAVSQKKQTYTKAHNIACIDEQQNRPFFGEAKNDTRVGV